MLQRRPLIIGLPSFILACALFWALAHSWLPLAPVGELINPFHGMWRHQAATDRAVHAGSRTLSIPGLHGPVTIQFDTEQVPHIFADNDDDLYVAEGYVIARDRLFQMDFLTRMAGGHLSEVIGAKTIPLDTMFIELGLPQAAKDSLELMQSDSATRVALDGYTRGVNAWIEQLKPSDYPYEFKLLNFKPEAWTPLKSALLVKFMAFYLAGYSEDLLLSRSRLRLSEKDFEDLFPLHPQALEPVIPKEKTWSFSSHAHAPPAHEFETSVDLIQAGPTPHPGNGSNNWAVSGSKSTTGYPIVANDVHLSYSLPSLWYEIQLRSPKQNVMGASLAGTPGVVIGFNQNVAWAVTNATTDVMDWYELRFRDATHREYMHAGSWRPVISQEQTLRVRGQEPITLTLRRTHYGPVPYTEKDQPFMSSIPKGVALRWAVLDPSNEIKSFIGLNHAKDWQACQDALQEYGSPGQNFICSDKKNISLMHNARAPVRWWGQGRMIGDGTDPTYEWHDWIPKDEMPFVKNPARGFVSSANQIPTAANYPHYLGSNWPAPYRGMRINEILRGQTKFSPDDMKAMQKDTLSVPARLLTPVFVQLLAAQKLSERQKQMLQLLKNWDFRFDKDSSAAPIFQSLWLSLEDAIWRDKFPDRKRFLYPSTEKTTDLILNDQNSKWFDNRETPHVETLPELIKTSFDQVEKDLALTLGQNPSKWRWLNYQPTTLLHLSRIPGLSETGLHVQGSKYSIFANTGDHGPDWKMVVALGPTPKAWSIYPGGQAGDPSSRYYLTFAKDWQTSRLHEMRFLQAPTGDGYTWKLETKP